MRILANFFPKFGKSRLALGILGLCALGLLIWFLGPWLGLHSGLSRCLMILAVVLVFIAVIVGRWYYADRKGRKLHEQMLAQEPGTGASRQMEIMALKQTMFKAISSIKSSELGAHYRGRAALYALPWYVIIGPSAAGKSTLLRNSGLHFPYANEDEVLVQGFSGTRNCDWWFSDEAIILDTAGRYTTSVDDHEEWTIFLNLLKKYRTRMPINGIVVAISMAELLKASEKEFDNHIKVIRERVGELYKRLGFIFPVYLTFTKCDLMPGFNEFFVDMRDQERQQPWGINLRGIAAIPMRIQHFGSGLEELYTKLTAQRVHRLAVERDPLARVAIYEFPEQFKSSFERMTRFFELLSRENPYQETPLFEGVYFTSGTQEGATVQQAKAKSFFIKDVFRQVVFKTHVRLTKNPRQALMLLGIKTACLLGSTAAVVGGMMLYSTSFSTNALLLKKGVSLSNALVATWQQRDSNTDMRFAAVTDLFNHYQTLQHYQTQVPLYMRLGLYRGNSQMPAIAGSLYTSLTPLFFNPVTQYLNQQLQVDSQQWQTGNEVAQDKLRGDYYSTLKTYLMLAEPARLQIEQAVPILTNGFSLVLTGQPYRTQNEFASLGDRALPNLVKFYLEQYAVNSSASTTFKPDVNSVQRARQQLYSPTNADNLYAQLRSSEQQNLGTSNLGQLLNGYGSEHLISNQRLSNFYTAKAWENTVKPAIEAAVAGAGKGDWVMGDDLSLKNKAAKKELQYRLQQQMEELYFNKYGQSWFKFINSIKVQPFTSLSDASNQLTILADPQGPLGQLFKLIARNFSLGSHALFNSPLSHFAKDMHGLNTYVAAPHLQQLAAVQGEVASLAVSSDAGRDAETYAKNLLFSKNASLALYKASVITETGLQTIHNAAAKQALQTLLLSPLQATWQVILTTAQQGLQEDWQNEVMGAYQQTIAGHFPFSPGSNDAAVADVSNFFRPQGGILASFVQNNLSAFLNITAGGMRPLQWLGIGMNFSNDFLSALSRGQRIGQELFSTGSQNIGFSYQIYPVPTPGISQINFASNDQKLIYQNGPQEWQDLKWPGQDTDQETVLIVIADQNNDSGSQEYSGFWGLFHWLASANMTAMQGGAYKGTWNIPLNGGINAPIHMLLRSNTGASQNVFTDINSTPFYLPNNMFNTQG